MTHIKLVVCHHIAFLKTQAHAEHSDKENVFCCLGTLHLSRGSPFEYHYVPPVNCLICLNLLKVVRIAQPVVNK